MPSALDVTTAAISTDELAQRQQEQVPQPVMPSPPALTLGPVEQLLMEKTLVHLYPRLNAYHLPFVERFLGALIPQALISSTPPNTRRIVVIHCGDGLLCNILAMVFPKIEIVGIDPSAHKIVTAKGTVGKRNNLTFIHGQPNLLPEIPCDRIIYNDSLLACKTSAAFKKLILKTSQWLVSEGDWIVQESPWRMLQSFSLMGDMLAHFWGAGRYKASLQDLLADVGYIKTAGIEEMGFPGVPARILLHASLNKNQASMLTFMNMASANSPEKTATHAAAVQEAIRHNTPPRGKSAVTACTALDDLFTDELHLPLHWELT